MKQAQSLSDLLKKLDEKQEEIKRLMAEVTSLIEKDGEKSKLHAKRLVKEGMSDYFNGIRRNPYKKGSNDAELWQYGFDISADSWEEMKK